MIKQIMYCDRCGKECEFVRDTLGYELTEHHTKMDLCQGCYDSLNRWLKENEEASPTGSEVLDRIRAELHATAEMHEDGDYYLREEWIDEIFDKYKASPTGAESEGME